MKGIAEYVVTIIFAVLFMLFFDMKIGFPILIVLLISPVISIAMTLMVKKSIKVSFKGDSTVLNKGDIITCDVAILNNSILPVPFIKVNIDNTFNLENVGECSFGLALGPKKTECFCTRYKAVFFGEGTVNVSSVKLSDILGLVEFELLPKTDINKYRQTYNILPDIPNVDEDNALLRVAFDAVAYADDEQECISENQLSAGFPGCEHRQYNPGDSFKKVNWKLSSKRRKLLVRLDENTVSFNQNIIIDPYSYSLDVSKSKERYAEEEKIIEACLSILELIVKNQVICSVYYYDNNKWCLQQIKCSEDIHLLQYKLSYFKFIGDSIKERIPLELLSENNRIRFATVFSVSADKDLCTYIESLTAMGMQTHVVVNKNCIEQFDNLWIVNDMYQFQPMYR